MGGTRELLTLQALSGDLQSADQFAEVYEELLLKAQAEKDFEMMRRMRNLLLHQAAYLMTLWFEEDAKMRKQEQRGGVQ